MNEKIILEIANNLNIKVKQVEVVLGLLGEGNTIPFIARYRKELTGALDEEVINEINKSFEYQNNLLKRKEDVIRLIDEKGLLTDELRASILSATKLVEVEDLYRPFKEKKKTKATEAIAKGLEPFAKWLLEFNLGLVSEEAKKYLSDKVNSVEEAISGAKDIIAEIVSDEARYRKVLRLDLIVSGDIETSKKKDAIDEKQVYEMYYDYYEPIAKVKPHRILAINRAEEEKIITAKLEYDRNLMLGYLEKNVIKNKEVDAAIYVKEALADSLKRLIYPSLEREVRAELTERAEVAAIEVFSDNLQKLLLQPPMKGKVVLGVDPAFRTGCKLSVINEQGTFLAKSVIYPHEKKLGGSINPEDVDKSKKEIVNLVRKHAVSIIAIGNGTASRETEAFIASTIKEYHLSAKYVIVNEAGASVYSASELAREEFADFSVEERSAISIARRLQDPLSELVKIDPKSIGVGQYQHDVTAKKLNESLNFVVTQAVNQVGVNVNTASKALLTYVSGLDKRIAENIVKYRDKNGKFKTREDINGVPRLGSKVYEQAIGFLRITDGIEPLDMTSIHPESYPIARAIMEKYNITSELFGKASINEIIKKINKKTLATELKTDTYTLEDILLSFVAPLRDPRDEFPQPILKSDILTLEDLNIGMELQGTVRNVVDFGAFVDFGLKEDGLVHISKMSNNYISHPKEVVHVGDIVKVYVFSIDKNKGKVALTMVKEKLN